MTTKDAVAKVLVDRGITKYRMAKDMDAFPISVNQWLSGTKMNDQNRVLFLALYGVAIDDKTAS